MLRPIPPVGDFRPYLHIHDHDFSLLVNSNKPQAGVVVGVTVRLLDVRADGRIHSFVTLRRTGRMSSRSRQSGLAEAVQTFRMAS
jgi:hypothetical protein